MKPMGLPMKFSATPGAVTCAAPVLGEHTYEVLAEVGYSHAEIDRLVREGGAIAANG